MIFRFSDCIFHFASRIVAALVLAVFAFEARAGVPTVEGLFPQVDGLLRDALEQSPAMLTRNLERMQAESLAMVSSSRIYPSMSAGMQYDIRTEDRADLNVGFVGSDRLTYNFTISQSIYSWGAVRRTAEIGRIQAALASKHVLGAYRQLALDIRGSYLNLILQKMALRNARLDLDLTRKAYEVQKISVDSGELVPNMLIGPRRSVEEKTLGLRRSELGFAAVVRQFRRLTGHASFDASQIPETIPAFAPVETVEVDPFRVNFVEQDGLKRDMRFAAASSDLTKEQLNLLVLKTSQRPKLDVVAGVSQEEQSYTANVAAKTRVTAAFFGVRVNWNIFDGFATRGQVRASHSRIRALERALADVEDGLRETAAQAAAELEFVKEDLRLAEENFAGAQGSYNSVKETVAAGRGTEDHIRGAQLALDVAEHGAAAARARYLNTVAAFLFAVNADPAVNAAAGSILKH